MRPILIVTPSGRTGTTLLMSLLAQHNQIVAENSYPYELRLLQACTPNQYVKPADLLGYPFQDDRDQKLACLTECLETSTPLQYYEWLAERQAKRATYAAEKLVGISVEAIKSAYPDARIVISMRDPRDTLLSARRFDALRGVHGFIERPGDTDLDVVRRTGLHLNALMHLEKSENCLVVKYEGLVHKIKDELLALTSWLEIDEFKDPAAPEHLHHRTSTSNESSIGRWREEMPSDLVQLCDNEWSNALENFGYT